MDESLPSTEQRVPRHTDEEINARIRREMEARICYYSRRLDEIEQRLDEIDREWDIERALEAGAAVFGTMGILLGLRNPRWRLLSIAVGGFLLQHALQGWCPPLELFRRVGLRTASEIGHERYALKALRGDFDDIHSASEEDPDIKADKALRAAQPDI
jgi:hypothetical protein